MFQLIVLAPHCDIDAVNFNAISDACLIKKVCGYNKDSFVYGFADFFW